MPSTSLKGAPATIELGAALSAFGCLALLGIGQGTSYWAICAQLIVIGGGLACWCRR